MRNAADALSVLAARLYGAASQLEREPEVASRELHKASVAFNFLRGELAGLVDRSLGSRPRGPGFDPVNVHVSAVVG